MEAGREMDAVIAEKVMGATWRTDGPAEGYAWLRFPGERTTSWMAPEILASREVSGPVTVHHDCPSYSTDGRLALEVAATFDTWHVCRVYDPGFQPYSEPFYYRATVTGFEADAFGDAHAPTPPLAICRAALKAVGVIVDH